VINVTRAHQIWSLYVHSLRRYERQQKMYKLGWSLDPWQWGNCHACVKLLATDLIGRLMVTDQLNFIWKHFIKLRCLRFNCWLRNPPISIRKWCTVQSHIYRLTIPHGARWWLIYSISNFAHRCPVSIQFKLINGKNSTQDASKLAFLSSKIGNIFWGGHSPFRR